jgi:hypothetical protein
MSGLRPDVTFVILPQPIYKFACRTLFCVSKGNNNNGNVIHITPNSAYAAAFPLAFSVIASTLACEMVTTVTERPDPALSPRPDA